MNFNAIGIFFNDLRTRGKLQVSADTADAGEIYLGSNQGGVNGDGSAGIKSTLGTLQVKSKNGNWGTLTGTNTGDQTSITGNAGTATSLAGGLGGQVPYQSAANVTAFLANGSEGQVLTAHGTTVAPSWVTPNAEIDGGAASSVYLVSQSIDCGGVA